MAEYARQTDRLRNGERIDLRADLLEQLSGETRQRMSEALLREATEGNRSGSVIRAYELVREIVDAGGEAGVGGEPDFSGLSDEQLRSLLAEWEGGGYDSG